MMTKINDDYRKSEEVQKLYDDPDRKATPIRYKKQDDTKLRMDLLPPIALQAAAAVLGANVAKYGEHTWREGVVASRTYASITRHLLAWYAGEDLDCESGHSHLAHAQAQLMILIQTLGDLPFLDDREFKHNTHLRKEKD